MLEFIKAFVANLLGLYTPTQYRAASQERRSVEYNAGYEAAMRRLAESAAARPPPQVVYTHRLTQPVYEALELQLSQTVVNHTVSSEMVAHQLGVQHALATIRKGFVA